MCAGQSAIIPVVSIVTTTSSGSGVSVSVLVEYPEGTGVAATQFTQLLNGGSTSWLTAQYSGAAVSGVSFSNNGTEPPLPPPSPPPPAPPPPVYVPSDALPGTPSLPSDIQVQDIPPGACRISPFLLSRWSCFIWLHELLRR